MGTPVSKKIHSFFKLDIELRSEDFSCKYFNLESNRAYLNRPSFDMLGICNIVPSFKQNASMLNNDSGLDLKHNFGSFE